MNLPDEIAAFIDGHRVARLATADRAGVPHGGIRPSNLYFSGGDRVRVILGDACLSPGSMLDESQVGDAARYLAPEAMRSAEPSSDLYAVGCIML